MGGGLKKKEEPCRHINQHSLSPYRKKKSLTQETTKQSLYIHKRTKPVHYAIFRALISSSTHADSAAPA